MMRPSHTLALIAASVGVPYAATETELGRSAVQSITAKTASLETPAPPAPDNSTDSKTDSVPGQRELERIWEKSIDRYRYTSTPLVVSSQQMPPGTTAAATVSSRTSRGTVYDQVGGAGVPPATSPIVSMVPQGSLVGGPIHDLREVLRFDITPDWVTSRFSRVTTVLASTELEGFRVPVVTGIGTSDLAGTITYYFNYSGKLQRVMLHAFTGDVSRVVETMTQHYGLQAEPTLDAGVYTRRWNGRPVHFLRITRAPVVYSDALHHKFTVFLELNQPELHYGISDEAQQIIDADRGIGRW